MTRDYGEENCLQILFTIFVFAGWGSLGQRHSAGMSVLLAEAAAANSQISFCFPGA